MGGYYLKLNGEVDALVFSGGIGERSKEIRQVIGGKMACLGFEAVDAEKNEKMDALEGVVVDLGAGRADGEGVVEGKGKKLLVCRTDEQVSRSGVRCGVVSDADVGFPRCLAGDGPRVRAGKEVLGVNTGLDG